MVDYLIALHHLIGLCHLDPDCRRLLALEGVAQVRQGQADHSDQPLILLYLPPPIGIVDDHISQNLPSSLLQSNRLRSLLQLFHPWSLLQLFQG